MPQDQKGDSEKGVEACPAQPTTRIALIANLHAESAATDGWDPARPEATSRFAVGAAPYTREGRTVELRIFFAPTSDDTWAWHALANKREGAQELGSGWLRFDAEGALVETRVVAPLRLPHGDGSLSAPIQLDVGAVQDDAHDGYGGLTATAQPSRLESYEQDGSAAGEADDCS